MSADRKTKVSRKEHNEDKNVVRSSKGVKRRRTESRTNQGIEKGQSYLVWQIFSGVMTTFARSVSSTTTNQSHHSKETRSHAATTTSHPHASLASKTIWWRLDLWMSRSSGLIEEKKRWQTALSSLWRLQHLLIPHAEETVQWREIRMPALKNAVKSQGCKLWNPSVRGRCSEFSQWLSAVQLSSTGDVWLNNS